MKPVHFDIYWVEEWLAKYLHHENLLRKTDPQKLLKPPRMDAYIAFNRMHTYAERKESREQQRMESPTPTPHFSRLARTLPYHWGALNLEGLCNADHIGVSSLQNKIIKPVVSFVNFSEPQCNYLDAPVHANHDEQWLILIRSIMCSATEKTYGFWAKDIKSIALCRKLLKSKGGIGRLFC